MPAALAHPPLNFPLFTASGEMAPEWQWYLYQVFTSAEAIAALQVLEAFDATSGNDALQMAQDAAVGSAAADAAPAIAGPLEAIRKQLAAVAETPSQAAAIDSLEKLVWALEGGTSPAGGTSAFPFAVIQESQITRNGAVTSWTYMFPQALQASGATGFMLLALNGATTPTYPAGWTVVFDIVNSQAPTGGGNDVRIVLLVKASAGDTTAVFGFSAGTSAAMYFFELNGARSVGTFSSAGGSWTTYGSSEGSAFGLPPITPSAGSLVFGMAAFCGDELAQQAPCISPAWRAIGALAASGGGYGLIGFVAQVGAAAAAITPPTAYTPFPIEENAGAAWVSFAIN